MRLPMFDVMDASIALLDKRLDFYQGCANEIQNLIHDTLSKGSLLSVSARVKKPLSMREKVLRKQLYLKYSDSYSLLCNLSDLIGIRAECRFLREESELYRLLCAACTHRHDDGTFSIPSNLNIRFELETPQPQTQQNGLSIYRIDGHYHKNGVSAPFELQIKALVHVFWSEVEHRLIYKNNSYILMDSFLKDLLYSNYERLKQIDKHLQLIYDQMQTPTPDLDALREYNFRPVVAKTLSDLFMRHMKNELGFSLRLDNTCDILAFYLISRGERNGNPLITLMENISNAATKPISFGDSLDLGEGLCIDDPFLSPLGEHLCGRLNSDYNFNLFFRLLFALEQKSPAECFCDFLTHFKHTLCEDSLYSPLQEHEIIKAREGILSSLTPMLIKFDDISMFSEKTILKLSAAIKRICDMGCHNEADRVEHVLSASLRGN